MSKDKKKKRKKLFFPAALVLITGGFFLPAASAGIEDLHDHKAEIIRVRGDARILKHQTSDWLAAAAGMTIEAGDQITTRKDSWVDLAYDAKRLNTGRVNPETLAEFTSIEPTDIHLSDGSLFNFLDGLENGQNYQVTTPTAVAAVRGTHFDVRYQSRKKLMDVGVFKDKNPDKSEVQITPAGGGGQSFQIPEGYQAAFDPEGMAGGQVGIDPVADDRSAEAGETAQSLAEINNEPGDSNRSSGDAKEMTQGEFALLLVKEAGALRLLSPAASGQDAIDFLMSLGFAPEKGWDVNAPVTDEFLNSLLGEEGTYLTREEIIKRLKELIEGRFGQRDATVFPGGNGVSG